MSDTPRTQQLVSCDYHKIDGDEVPLSVYQRMIDHSCDLELENADLRRQNAYLKAELKQLEREDTNENTRTNHT